MKDGMLMYECVMYAGGNGCLAAMKPNGLTLQMGKNTYQILKEGEVQRNMLLLMGKKELVSKAIREVIE